MLRELYHLGHYPARTSKKTKTATEKAEDSLAQRISKKYEKLCSESRAYVDAVFSKISEVLNDPPDESDKDSTGQVGTGNPAESSTPQDVELLYATALQGAAEWEQTLLEDVALLGRYPRQIKAKEKSDAELKETQLARLLSNKKSKLREQSIAYLEASRAQQNSPTKSSLNG